MYLITTETQLSGSQDSRSEVMEKREDHLHSMTTLRLLVYDRFCSSYYISLAFRKQWPDTTVAVSAGAADR